MVNSISQFTNECLELVGNKYGLVETKVCETVDGLIPDDGSVRDGVTWCAERKEHVANIIFGLAVLYNFSNHLVTFSAGALLGGYLSKESDGEDKVLPSLKDRSLLSLKRENGFQAQKMMVLLTVLNKTLGGSRLDNTLTGLFTGLLTGNTVIHLVKDHDGVSNLFSAVFGRAEDEANGSED